MSLGRPYPSYPEAERASEQYAYVDPKKAPYAIARLPREFHPLDAWNAIGTDGWNSNYYRYYYPLVTSTVGFVVTMLASYINRQPLWSNIPRTVIATAGAGLLGEWTYHATRASAAKRDAVIQNYLEQNYDEFSKIKRVKYGEVFLPWKCCR